MTKPVVTVEPAPDAPGILHIDTDGSLHGPVPKHDVGRAAEERARDAVDTPDETRLVPGKP